MLTFFVFDYYFVGDTKFKNSKKCDTLFKELKEINVSNLPYNMIFIHWICLKQTDYMDNFSKNCS